MTTQDFPWACLALAGRNSSPWLFVRSRDLKGRPRVKEPGRDPHLRRGVQASRLRAPQPRAQGKTRDRRRNTNLFRKNVILVQGNKRLPSGCGRQEIPGGVERGEHHQVFIFVCRERFTDVYYELILKFDVKIYCCSHNFAYLGNTLLHTQPRKHRGYHKARV